MGFVGRSRRFFVPDLPRGQLRQASDAAFDGRKSRNHPEWVYEIKHDGFRALAYVSGDQCQLVSRKGYIYKRFVPLAEQIARSLKAKDAVLDGEIVCLDRSGKSQFKSLMYRRGTPYFYAFDILRLNGRDLRSLPLITRKRQLRRLIPTNASPLLYVSHIEERGEDLFRLACREDLEGIVAKWKDGRYDPERLSSWIKIKNPAYSQIIGRDDLFEKRNKSPRLGHNPRCCEGESLARH